MKGHRLQALVYSLIIFLLLLVASELSPVFAQEDNLGQSQITPASPLYFLKSVREILELKFAGTPRVKAIRELEFATRRIREVKGLVNTSRRDLIEPTLYQYLFRLNEFIGQEELIGTVSFQDQDFATEVSNTIVSQTNALQKIYGYVSNDTSLVSLRDERALMSLRATINYLSKWDLRLINMLILAEKPLQAEQVSISRLSACNFLSKEASSSALNEIEKSVFVKRASECLKPVIKP